MRFVDAQTVHRLLDWPGLIEALRFSHRGPMPETARAVLEEPRPSGLPNMLLALPTWQHGEALGVKLVASFPGNVAAFNVPTVDALYILFSPQTGKPQLVIDGEALIFRKTAADSALGASFLARKESARLLMVGAGALAPYVVEAMLTVRPGIREVRIWNRTAERAATLATSLRQQGIPAVAASDLDREVPEADIIVGATMATSPLVKGALLKPGAHVNLIGSFTPDMREADDHVLRRARIYVDDFGCLERSGEFIAPLRDGVITGDDVHGNLFDLCQAEPPPAFAPDDITLFKNGGAGQLDLFVARHLYQRLEELEHAA